MSVILRSLGADSLLTGGSVTVALRPAPPPPRPPAVPAWPPRPAPAVPEAPAWPAGAACPPGAAGVCPLAELSVILNIAPSPLAAAAAVANIPRLLILNFAMLSSSRSVVAQALWPAFGACDKAWPLSPRRDGDRGRPQTGRRTSHTDLACIAGRLHYGQAHAMEGLLLFALEVLLVGHVPVVHADQLTFALYVEHDLVVRFRMRPPRSE